MKLALLLLFATGCILADDRVVKEKIQTNEVHWQRTHEHNLEYDHEAFLGKDKAKVYEELTPEESKRRLGEIFHKIDKDNDGYVTNEELKLWVTYTQNDYIWNDAEHQLHLGDRDNDGHLSWKEYKRSKYGVIDKLALNDSKILEEEYISRDQRRFKRADANHDGILNPEEVAAFLHPEHHDHTKDVYVQETLDDLDHNKDGYLNMEEYLSDVWPVEERKGVIPDWVDLERETFQTVRDQNKDGKMDRDEILAWILPQEGDEVTPEISHLIEEADTDNDERLSKSEMLGSYELFVGSQATHVRIAKTLGEAGIDHEEL